jgi:hypothetical protein
MSLFQTIIIKKIFGKNVALTSFVGKIAIVVVKNVDSYKNYFAHLNFKSYFVQIGKV